MKKNNYAAFLALLAAAMYAVSIPMSKLLLDYAGQAMMAGFLYLGAGIGTSFYTFVGKASGKLPEKEPLTKKELPYTVAMVVLDIAAPIMLMAGIARTNSANVSLLNNFEIVSTSLIALVVFKEVVSKRLWLSIGLVTAASILLSFEGRESFVFSTGSILVLCAAACWGLENNCTRMLSTKSSEEIVIIKGLFSGLGSLVVALTIGERLPELKWAAVIMLLGFISYGMSINFYIMAQKELGAAKTSAYYSVSPFLGVAFSLLFLGERPEPQFYAALVIMAVSTVLMTKDTVQLQHNHSHEHVHSHMHSHGDITHSHEHSHIHSHLHVHNDSEETHMHGHMDLHNHDHLHDNIS